jgi:hypothetical protein
MADTMHWDAVDPAAVRLGWVKRPTSLWLVESCSVVLTYLGLGSVNLTTSWGSKDLLGDTLAHRGLNVWSHAVTGVYLSQHTLFGRAILF